MQISSKAHNIKEKFKETIIKTIFPFLTSLSIFYLLWDFAVLCAASAISTQKSLYQGKTPYVHLQRKGKCH